MALPASGTTTLGMVATELGASTPLSLGDSGVRSLAVIPSGSISLSNLYGKSNVAPMSSSASVASSNNGVDTYYAAQTVSANLNATATGGTGGYTYAWAFTSNPNNCQIVNTTSATCTVYQNAPFRSNGSVSFSAQCTVRDSSGNSILSNVVSYSMRWLNSRGL